MYIVMSKMKTVKKKNADFPVEAKDLCEILKDKRGRINRFFVSTPLAVPLRHRPYVKNIMLDPSLSICATKLISCL